MARPPTVIARLERRCTMPEAGGGALYFIVHAGRRPAFLQPSEVPDFDGPEAWFEVERARGPVWKTWKVLRQVEKPSWAR